jgi:hypothetical protein
MTKMTNRYEAHEVGSFYTKRRDDKEVHEVVARAIAEWDKGYRKYTF